MHLNGITHITNSSIGITLFSHETNGSSDLLKEAAFALYQAKVAGRNAIRYFDDEMHAQYTKKSNLESKLRRALAEGELSLVYQPQVDQLGKIIGAEALLRWESEGVQATYPDVFIPMAEEGGFIVPIGEWVLKNACMLLANWANSECTNKLFLSVNLSAKQFKLPNFVEVVESIITSTGANPNLLKFELTESLLLEDMEVVISTMKALRKIGVKFSIDDFGTGYSSLSYVKKLPIDEIKIDKSFVHDVSWDEGDRAIIRSILSLAHSLNLKVVAEGVETLEQRDFLYSEGCFFYQGFFYGKPLTEENFDLLVRSLA
jgi:EAL domain-containing protein (putative c-di-GMP-specific phosphodiesterase class I)